MLKPSMPRSTTTTPRRIFVAALAAALAFSLASASVAEAKTYTFKGRGWGHGLGMSQWGARGLAAKGLTASRILRYYYTGTALETKTAPSGIRVGLLQERSDILIEGDGRFDLHDSSGALRASGASGQRWRVVPSGSSLKVYKPGATSPAFTSSGKVTVRWEQHGTLLKLPQTGYSYKHGRMDVSINPSSGKARSILLLPFEQYLYGLGEMPASWHTEALKAQAIAGRTYALEKILRLGQGRSVCHCAVYATVADQAYVGVAHEVERWVAAVNSTKGLVVTYVGKPIEALYSSSSGGYTENNENVFGGTARPYLRGRCDTGDYNSGDNPHSNWVVTMDSLEIEQRLRDSGRNIGTLQSIAYVPPRGVSGRLTPLQSGDRGGVRMVGSLATIRLSGGTFRAILGLKTSLVHYNIAGPIRTRWDALRCAPGLPRWNEFAWEDLDGTARGRAQNFNGGRLFYNTTTGKVFWTRNEVLPHYDYHRSKGLDLGMPRTDTLALTNGKVSVFEHGRIYYSPATGPHEVHGPILEKYYSIGGHWRWGYPTTDEIAATGGRASKFQKANIYWSSANGAHHVYGKILARYAQTGWSGGSLGLPIGDEYTTKAGRRRQYFKKGYIEFDPATGKTIHKVA